MMLRYVILMSALAAVTLASPIGFGGQEGSFTSSTVHHGKYMGSGGSGEGGGGTMGGGYSSINTHQVAHVMGGGGGGGGGVEEHYEKYHFPEYKYDYAVKDFHTGDHKKAWEQRHGDMVKGGYMMKEADGTTRLVEYQADKHNGFNAIVKNIGHAEHPMIYGKMMGGFGGGYGGY